MKNVLWPYKMTSEGCAELASRLKMRRVFADRKFKPSNDTVVINWGNSHEPIWSLDTARKIINHPHNVILAADKLQCFETLKATGVPTVQFTTSKEQAQKWSDNGSAVYARKLLRSSEGKGIEVITECDEVCDAPLYTKGILKGIIEFRVHVLDGYVIHAARKMRVGKEKRSTLGVELNKYIKNHSNGWVFTTESVSSCLSNHTARVATSAVASLGLDFGAVDIIQQENIGSFVLEINTAPGITGVTLEAYTNAFTHYLEKLNAATK